MICMIIQGEIRGWRNGIDVLRFTCFYLKKTFLAGIYKFDKITLYASVLPGDASNLRYFS